MTKEEILQKFPEMPAEAADWMAGEMKRQQKEQKLSAEIRLAGGRSEEAVRALLNEQKLFESEDPDAEKNAVKALKAEKAWLFEPERPAAYSAAAGTSAAGENTDTALRAAFGLE